MVDTVRGSTALKDVTALVEDELAEVATLVEDALRPQSDELRPLVDHVGGFRGKRLRPAIVLLVGKALGRDTRTHLKVAAIVEMIHAATLVHDDILDGALVRRNLATLNAIHGSEVSVLLGDYIYAKAFHLSVSLADQRCSRRLAEITRIICQGEMVQMLHRFDMELTEQQYLRVIGEKTASLYGAASELGALYAEADESVCRAFADFGYQLGLAFQIIDDCLDVEGDEDVVGKSLGTDFGKGKLTLPFLWVLRRLDAAGRRRFEEIFLDQSGVNGDGRERQRRLAAEFDLSGGLDYARRRATDCLRQAVVCLEGMPQSEYLEALRVMAGFVVSRRS